VIHKTAIIDKKAEIDEGVEVGPYTVIGPDVKVKKGTWIGPHAVLKGPTEIGKNNKIFQFTSIGEDTQDKKFNKEQHAVLKIGDRNVIREGASIHRGTVASEGMTVIGNDNLFMGYVHIAHACNIGNHNTFVNHAALAGHITVGDYVIVSAFCGIHQFCKIGSYAFISHASMISKDVPPYVMITGGSDPGVCGLNVEGLKRRGFTPDDIASLRQVYKLVYRQGLRVVEAVAQLREMEKDCKHIKLFADFLEHSERGIVR
jgi:UDP-N-acetylglucosamine acyltransferase